MSYILEALKKSDQQRQRGATPTLPAVQAPAAEPEQPVFLTYGLLAAALLAAGILIGWLRPWQPEQKTTQELPVPNSAPVAQSAPKVAAMKPDSPAPARTESLRVPAPAVTATPDKPVSPATTANTEQEEGVTSMAALPLAIRQEIPSMTIPLHAYSSKPRDRLVSINDRMLREGESLTPGLRLEQITPDGLIFSYKGYRFRRGVQ
jgi:general secretion pathway protein B